MHNHLLPGVDDGSASLEETMRYLRAFRVQGVDELVFTPHLFAAHLDAGAIGQTLALHRNAFDVVLDAAGADPSLPALHLGQEILARTPEDLDDVLGHPDVGMAESGALLVEFGFRPPFDAEGVIRRILADGRSVIVAHPERYRLAERDDLAVIARWAELGATLQVNGGSLAGLYSERSHESAWALLDAGLVEIIASDHHGDFRAHDPERSVHALAARASPSAIDRLMGVAPRTLLGLQRAGRTG